MKTIDIPLSRAMAKARREGRKSQTRRVVKPRPLTWDWPEMRERLKWSELLATCPYGVPGDSLRWVTTWATCAEWDHLKPTELPLAANWPVTIWTAHDSDQKPDWCGRLRPGRFMPLLFRSVLPVDEIVSVRVERLNEISEEDAIAEGCDSLREDWSAKCGDCDETLTNRDLFQTLWESINGPGSWELNDWVWVIEFRPLSSQLSALSSPQ